jgi:hypothetical protein
MEEPLVSGCRRSRMTTRVALLLMAGLAVAACNGSSSTATRLVGAHRVAVAVPADWKTDVEHGSFCAPTDPGTVEFFTPVHGGIGSCALPIGASWPAQDSVSIYTRFSGGVRTPHGSPSGTVHGMSYYISDSRQSGPGVAITLSVPGAGVSFLVGAADRDAALAFLATIRYVPAGTRLR